MRAPVRRGLSLLRTLADPGAWLHLVRLMHFYAYAHVRERRKLALAPDAELAPNVSLRHAERIAIGPRSRIGERASLWAGPSTGRITIGSDVLLAPEVFVTAADYGTGAGTRLLDQPRREHDVVIGDDVWLGARAVVVAGVTVGAGSIVGAGAVVTRDLPPGSIAVGAPARVVGRRGG